MKNCILLLTAMLFAVTLRAVPITQYNDTKTYIAGTGGNPNTGWTTGSNTDSPGLSVSLRAKNRVDGTTPNVNGVYTFASAPATRGMFNFEFSMNTPESGPLGFQALTSFDFYLSVDRDHTAGILFHTVNPLTHWNDNSFGTSVNGPATGAEGPASSLAGTNTIAQNSQNITFGGPTPYPGGALSLEQNATYDFELFATAIGAGMNGQRLVTTSMSVVVDNGGTPAANVPDAGSTAGLLALSVMGLVMANRRHPKNEPVPVS